MKDGMWRVEQPAQESKRIVDAGGNTVAGIVTNDYDAQYIVKAANNYPRLVDALRSMVKPQDKFSVIREQEARALLRELGEA